MVRPKSFWGLNFSTILNKQMKIFNFNFHNIFCNRDDLYFLGGLIDIDFFLFLRELLAHQNLDPSGHWSVSAAAFAFAKKPFKGKSKFLVALLLKITGIISNKDQCELVIRTNLLFQL